MNAKEIDKKLQEYEHFIEHNLKKDLGDVEVILKAKTEKYSEWEEVKNVVRTVQEFKCKNRDLHVKFPVGEGVLMEGEINDFERTYVDIGLGYLLEMDCEEADKYSNIRMKLLNKEIEHFRKLAVDIKVHIKLVLLAMNELKSSGK